MTLIKMRSFLLVCCCMYSVFSSAQEKETKKTDDKHTSYFKASANYLSNSLYNGRKDSLATPYISPGIGYYDKSGFYITGGISYLASSSESRIDLVSFDAGYDFSFSDNFTGGVYANKSFYNQSSTAVKSDIKGSIGGTLSYDLGFLQLSTGIDVLFADKADIALNFGLAHAFYVGDKDDLWTITPSVTTNLSTLNFYEGYTNRRVGKNAKSKIPNLASITTTTTVNNSKLTLMDYEISLPINYDGKKWGLFFTPTLALPQNPISTTTVSNIKLKNGTESTETHDTTPPSEKNLQNTFYVEVGVYIKF